MGLEGCWGGPHLFGMAPRIPMIWVHSSSIAAGGYDARSGTLRLCYIDGDTYDYRNVPSAVFDDFLNAASKGRFVNWHVKPHYSYVRVVESGARLPRSVSVSAAPSASAKPSKGALFNRSLVSSESGRSERLLASLCSVPRRRE
jgi:hypothetical protein